MKVLQPLRPSTHAVQMGMTWSNDSVSRCSIEPRPRRENCWQSIDRWSSMRDANVDRTVGDCYLWGSREGVELARNKGTPLPLLRAASCCAASAAKGVFPEFRPSLLPCFAAVALTSFSPVIFASPPLTWAPSEWCISPTTTMPVEQQGSLSLQQAAGGTH